MNNKVYYHFLSSNNALIDLERGAIKVSLINELNDPFELKPYLRHKYTVRVQFNKVRKNVHNKFGLLCFSGKWNESLLWGHYADKHSGIALGFNLNRIPEEIIEVEYCSKRIKYELTNNTSLDEKNFMNLIGKRKYQNWSYENEYRVWVDLKRCIRINGKYFVKFDNEFILKEIRLGCRHDKSNYKYIVNLAHRYKSKVIPLREEFGGYKMVVDGRKKRKIEELQK